MRTLFYRIGSLLPLLAATPVAAQDTGRPWIVTMGLWTIGAPSFNGSDELALAVKPIMQFRREGEREWLNLPSDHGGPALFRTERFRIGPSINIEAERKAGDHAALAGLTDVPLTFEGGAFVEFWPGSMIRTRAELRRGIGGHEGLIANLSADVVLKPDARWTFTVGPRLAIADANYMAAYFGVTQAEAVSSGLRAYDPKAGLYSAGIGSSIKYQWTENWATLGYAQVDRLVGDAKESPITERGSETQITVGVGFTYTTQWDRLKFWER